MDQDRYLPELVAEKESLDASFVHAMRLLAEGKTGSSLPLLFLSFSFSPLYQCSPPLRPPVGVLSGFSPFEVRRPCLGCFSIFPASCVSDPVLRDGGREGGRDEGREGAVPLTAQYAPPQVSRVWSCEVNEGPQKWAQRQPGLVLSG